MLSKIQPYGKTSVSELILFGLHPTIRFLNGQHLMSQRMFRGYVVSCGIPLSVDEDSWCILWGEIILMFSIMKTFWSDLLKIWSVSDLT